MRSVLGGAAVVLGCVGLLWCTAAAGFGWWAALQAVERIDRAAARLDQGLAAADARLARVEDRLNAVRTDINSLREAIAAVAAENPELPRVQAEIERLLDRLVPAFERADALADSLTSVAAGLRTAADVVDQFHDDPGATVRVRQAADTIDRAAEMLNGLRANIEAVKSAKAVRLTRAVVTLAQEAAAGSERLAEGLAAARQEVAGLRLRTAEARDRIVFWIYAVATTNTLVWMWGGLGQACLIGWGRRQFFKPTPATPL